MIRRLAISRPVCGSGDPELPVPLLELPLGELDPLEEPEPLEEPLEPDPLDEPVTVTLAFMNGCGVQW